MMNHKGKYDAGKWSPRAALMLLLAAVCVSCVLPAAALGETLTCIVPDGQYVNVRNRASASASALGSMHTGETIDADPAQIVNGFFSFTFRERAAYVSVRYFEIPEETHYIVEANGRVRLRKSPGGEADGFIKPGAQVYVAAWRYGADGKKWARCTGGQYIAAQYLRPAQ
ncbi:MAG: hypothetical protein IKU34_04570 [Clostridia bacterium]|nr:hypothetical protein [Clostridia bacterium]